MRKPTGRGRGRPKGSSAHREHDTQLCGKMARMVLAGEVANYREAARIVAPEARASWTTKDESKARRLRRLYERHEARFLFDALPFEQKLQRLLNDLNAHQLPRVSVPPDLMKACQTVRTLAKEALAQTAAWPRIPDAHKLLSGLQLPDVRINVRRTDDKVRINIS